MALTLIVLNGSHSGKHVRVRTKKYLIGRSDDCHLRPRADSVSRHHCALMIDEPDVLIRDLGSRNGTFVNGQRVQGSRVLETGDKLSVGKLKLQVEIATLRKLEPAPVASDDVTDWIGEDTVGDTDIINERELASGDLAGAPRPYRDPLARHRASPQRENIDRMLQGSGE